jgi:ubiquinone/menaquinone biosynthesis C-methylase UbiE
MTQSRSMTEYYQARAHDYESVYQKPERQADLDRLRTWLANETLGLSVLEVACGTGYWTSVAARTASSIVATDFNSRPLEIARSKGLGCHVTFVAADAFALPAYAQHFDAGMAHFWWSHLAVAERETFLRQFAAKLSAGAKLLMIDNNFVPGSSTPISRTDALGNTYQLRRLGTAGEYEVAKNFPTSAELRRDLAGLCDTVDVLQLPHYWAVSARLG